MHPLPSPSHRTRHALRTLAASALLLLATCGCTSTILAPAPPDAVTVARLKGASSRQVCLSFAAPSTITPPLPQAIGHQYALIGLPLGTIKLQESLPLLLAPFVESALASRGIAAVSTTIPTKVSACQCQVTLTNLSADQNAYDFLVYRQVVTTLSATVGSPHGAIVRVQAEVTRWHPAPFAAVLERELIKTLSELSEKIADQISTLTVHVCVHPK